MGGQDDGGALLAQPPHHLPHVVTQLHVHTGRGLVQEQDARLVGERLGDQHTPLHAAGERGNLVVAFLPQRQLAQDGFQILRIGRLAEQPATETYRGPHRFERIGGQFLRHQADAGTRGAVVAHDVVPVGQHTAGAGVDQAADDADQGGLAGAVGAEQREDLATPDLKIHLFERLETAGIGLAQALDGNDRSHGFGTGTISATG